MTSQPSPSPSRKRIIADLAKLLRHPEQIISDESERKAFETDAFTARRTMPMLVVLPETTAEVSAVLQYCNKHQIKIVPRGAGTSLSGGAQPLEDGILLGLSKFNKILEIDYNNRLARVQPGVTNLSISDAVADEGFYYAPDPSSQMACSIGGNVAENSGGVHCLKYGLTTNNLLGVEFVTMNGDILQIGGKAFDSPSYDLLGIITGSEGLLGIVTEVTVKLLKKPATVKALLIGFDSMEDAGNCVADVIASGMIPAGLEIMDKAGVITAENFIHAGYPTNVEGLLIAEFDGAEEEVTESVEKIRTIANTHKAVSLQVSETEEQRLRFWAGRKASFPACAQLAPDYLVMDGTIPRNKLSYVLTRMKEMSEHYGLEVVNVFHAGDGNLHPLIMYDANKGEMQKAEDFGSDILKLCVEVGGVLSGEHGIGIEKRDLMPVMFSDTDLKHQQRLKCAFDPAGLLNPDKVYPQLHRCAELGRMHVHKGKLPFAHLPRF